MTDWIQGWLPLYYEHRGYYILPAVGIVLVGLRHVLWHEAVERRLGPVRLTLARRAALVLLVATAAFSVGVYNNFFHFHYGGYVNAYEFFHYYMGSKYAPEVGYFDLYGAALAADDDTGLFYAPDDGLVTELSTLRKVTVESVLADHERYRASFSPERWDEFIGDVFYFKKELGQAAWNRLFHDRGYNATPVWTMLVGTTLSRRIPTSSPGGMLFLALLDAMLLALATIVVWRVFGLWPALLMIVFLASSYLMAHVHMKGAFLRTDFVVSLVLAVCAMKRRRYATAGALVGYSTLSRIFPVVFLFGALARMTWDGWTRRRVARRYLRFLGGFAVTVALLAGLSLIAGGGPGAWSDFAHKIADHRRDYHIWNVGLPTIVAGDVEAPSGADGEFKVTLPPDAVERRRPLIVALQLLSLALAFAAVRGVEDHRALAFGFVPLFVLVAPTYYYYVVLLLPFLFLIEKLERPLWLAGGLYLFVFGIAGHWMYQRWEQRFPTYYGNSILVAILCAGMIVAAWTETRRSSPDGVD